MTAPYRTRGARPRKPYAAPRLTIIHRLWWAPGDWLWLLRWRLFRIRANNWPRGPFDPETRIYTWSERATVLLRPQMIETARYIARPWWMRLGRLAWWTITGRSR